MTGDENRERITADKCPGCERVHQLEIAVARHEEGDRHIIAAVTKLENVMGQLSDVMIVLRSQLSQFTADVERRINWTFVSILVAVIIGLATVIFKR